MRVVSCNDRVRFLVSVFYCEHAFLLVTARMAATGLGNGEAGGAVK